MYKVLALDLDGTVLTDEQKIHPEVKKAIQEAQHHCEVVIVTGRHHTAAKPYYRELGLNTPIIGCNGTYIYDYQRDRFLIQNAINREDALQFVALANEHQMKLVMYIKEAMVYSRQNPIAYMQRLEQWASQYLPSLRPDIRQIESFSQQIRQTDYIWKFVIEGEVDAVEHLAKHPFIQQQFSGERSWSNRIDFMVKGNNKGARLAEYIASLGYQPSQVMAVGDNHNDISMLNYAGLGVAMNNADPLVKANAQQICSTDNNQDGLAHLIYEKIIKG